MVHTGNGLIVTCLLQAGAVHPGAVVTITPRVTIPDDPAVQVIELV
jgi:hypothetical protein